MRAFEPEYLRSMAVCTCKYRGVQNLSIVPVNDHTGLGKISQLSNLDGSELGLHLLSSLAWILAILELLTMICEFLRVEADVELTS